jgi:hypothetical protein
VFRDFLHEDLGHRMLLAAVTFEPNEWEETIGACGTWVPFPQYERKFVDTQLRC